MAEYMLMILEKEADDEELAPSEMKALVEGHSAYERKLKAMAAYVDGERLRPAREGKRLGLRDGQMRIEAGPFGERALTGYYVVKADSLDDALALANECPMAPGSELDVRPLMKGNLSADKTAQPGRVFAFGVLGSAPNEQGWIDVMDRIDASTSEGFPTQQIVGGVRLHAPSRGRRVVASGNQRAIFDGPFLESKEVIGGLFFMRVPSLEEAVHWASQTPFIKYGSVEIRELWRS